ncbi:hypothetical protein CFP56_033915 [Quercus suber]|uniref:Uncharacterized protein n=1 Tax=Quercus suber TaxID=58331 RepID=A0AAW0JE76_QUESU
MSIPLKASLQLGEPHSARPPLAPIAPVNPDRPNPIPTNPSALVNPGDGGGHGDGFRRPRW